MVRKSLIQIHQPVDQSSGGRQRWRCTGHPAAESTAPQEFLLSNGPSPIHLFITSRLRESSCNSSNLSALRQTLTLFGRYKAISQPSTDGTSPSSEHRLRYCTPAETPHSTSQSTITPSPPRQALQPGSQAFLKPVSRLIYTYECDAILLL